MSSDSRVLCPSCGSDNVHSFRYDEDWGYGGGYTPVNDGIPESERPDIECLHCRECYAAFDGPSYDKDGKRADYLGVMSDRLAALEQDNARLQAELARVRALIGVWRRMHKAAVQVNDGHETAHHAVLKTCADQLDAALSQPAELDLSGAIRVMDKMANSLAGGGA